MISPSGPNMTGRGGLAMAPIVLLALCIPIGGILAAKGSYILVMAFLAAAGALVVYVKPEWGLFVTLIAVCTDEVGYFMFRIAGYPITTPKLAVALLLVCWFLHASLQRKPIVGNTPITSGLLSVIVSMLIAVMISGNYRRGIMDTQSVITLTIFVHVAYIALPTKQIWRISMANVWFILFLLIFTTYTGRTEERAAAGYGDPNEWGSAVVLLTHLALAVLAVYRSAWSGPALILLISLYVISIFQTASRATFLAAAATMPLGLYGLSKRPAIPIFALFAALLLVPLVVSDPAFIVERLSSAVSTQTNGERAQDGIGGRIFLAQYAWESFLENPIFGGGPGYVIGSTAEFFHKKGGRDTHNSYLQILAEQGVMGAVTHCFLGFVLLKEWVGAYRATTSPSVQTILYILMVGLIGYGIMMLSLGRMMDGALGYLYVVFLLGWCRAARNPVGLPASIGGMPAPGPPHPLTSNHLVGHQPAK